MNLTDIHTHILPGVDDGASAPEEALKMLRDCARRDTDTVLLTPHFSWQERESKSISFLRQRTEALRQAAAAAGIGVDLVTGAEVFVTPELEDLLQEGSVPTINGTKAVLAEFDFDIDGGEMCEALDMLRSYGLTPVIAHAERYRAVQQHPALALTWNRSGCGVQVNADSLFGGFGRTAQRTAHCLLEYNLVQFVASDCHDTDDRMPGLREAYRYLADSTSEGYAQILMQINPKELLQNGGFLIINPRDPER